MTLRKAVLQVWTWGKTRERYQSNLVLRIPGLFGQWVSAQRVCPLSRAVKVYPVETGTMTPFSQKTWGSSLSAHVLEKD